MRIGSVIGGEAADTEDGRDWLEDEDEPAEAAADRVVNPTSPASMPPTTNSTYAAGIQRIRGCPPSTRCSLCRP